MGNVTQGAENLGQLKIVGFQRLHELRPVEDGLYETDPDNEAQALAGRIEVRQGFYESSNTNAVNELVKMITNFRAYEATQRVIRQMDQSLQRLIRQSQ
jgi:flagellar basal-body rod protein FlgG